MGSERRKEFIAEIEKKRETKVIVYFTGDRPSLSTRIAPDAILPLYQHLSKMGKQKRIDLFLYTRGGDVITPLRINYLLREFTEEFNVIVPFRAYSAGTLLCLGADEIVMGVLGELGPIDPSVSNFFNPVDPNNPNARIPISVEDVFAYLSLARERGNQLGEHEMNTVFQALTEKIHPLSLGNIHRNYILIRNLAEKLLNLRKDSMSKAQIKEIVDLLTEKLYTHSYLISRKEAKEIGLPIVQPDDEMETLLWSLYKEYEGDLKLLEPFTPEKILLPGQKEIEFEAVSGILESAKRLDRFKFYGNLQLTMNHNQEMINVNIHKQQWESVH